VVKLSFSVSSVVDFFQCFQCFQWLILICVHLWLKCLPLLSLPSPRLNISLFSCENL
jgi:hypothetical protein